MKRYLAAVGLVLCLALSACNDGKEPVEQTSRLGEAAGLDEEAILLTVDGREIPAWRYLYWLGYTCQRVQERYTSAGLPVDWNTPVSGGTLADYAKDQALADTALYATVENWAERYGCRSGGEEQDGESRLPDLGLSEERMAELERVGILYGELYALYCTEGSELAPTEEALQTYGEEAGAVTLERLLIPAGEDREAARKKASELFAQINGATEQGMAFSALAAEYGEPVTPCTVLPEDRTLAEGLLDAAQALEEGQCSGILETEEGFSLLRRLPLDTAALKEPYFDHLLKTAAERSSVTVTDDYEALNPEQFANRFLPGRGM